MRAVLLFCLLALPAAVAASDACSGRAIVTAADVTVSDGSGFRTRSYFQSANFSAIRHLRDEEQWVVVEGPLSWVRVGDREREGGGFEKTFALGHQFHAFLLHFDELADNARPSEGVEFGGERHRAISGDYPFGGLVHRIGDPSDPRPPALVFAFPEAEPISAALSDWRETPAGPLPFRIVIDDGQRRFEYRYSKIDTTPRSPMWFFEQVPPPALERVQAQRLQLDQLAAHCRGEASSRQP